MKEAYFTKGNINSVAARMVRILSIIGQRDRLLSLQHSALLVLDMQYFFLDPSSHAYVPSAEAIIPNIQTLIDAYVNAGSMVVFTRHLNTPQDAGMMATWWRDTITSDSPLSLIVDAFDISNTTVLEKSQYDAFYNTGLERMLHKNNVSQVVICGVMTHLCCETTARSAFVRGFEVFFTVDGTATYNHDYHMASLLNLSHGFATHILVEGVRSEIEEKE